MKPKRILLAATHYPVASGRYITNALRRLGHEVVTVGAAMGNHIWGIQVDPRHNWTPDIQAAQGQHNTNYEGVIDAYNADRRGDKWIPDLVLTCDSAYAISGYIPCKTALYGVDNHVRPYDIGVVHDWDYKFLAHSFGYRMQDTNTTWLPCAYDPEYFTPSPIPYEQREWDICMIGVAYSNRIDLIRALHNAGLKVFAGTGLLYEDYAKAYQNSRIALCASVCGDLAQRVFECAALGCTILSDYCQDMPTVGLYEWTHYAPFGSVPEAVDTAKRLIASYREGQRLADESTRWTQTGQHTWDARCKVLLETVFNNE